MADKIKILVLASDRTGCSKFRSVDPHVMLQKLYPDDFWIDIDYSPKLDDDDFLKQYQIIHYHRSMSPNYDYSNKVSERLKKLGIIEIMDLDDYWQPTMDHPAYMLIKEQKIDEKIKGNLKFADYITTTTKLFADKIKPWNKNVVVFENGIDPSEKQFIPNPEKNDLIRIGYLAGSSHLADIEPLRGVAGLLDSNCKGKFQMMLCGFDTRGQVSQIDQVTKEIKSRPIQPHESVWYQYEKIFTENYTILDPKYKDYLMKFDKNPYSGEEHMPYRRVWTKPISTYASNYDKISIALAPLKEHIFNLCKSDLKFSECAFHKKAIIAQAYGPYLLEGVNEKNCILIDSSRNHKDWYKSLKKLIENPNMIQDLGEQLYEDLHIKYDLRTITKNRSSWYKTIVNEKNK